MRAMFYILHKDKKLLSFSLWRKGLAGLFGKNGAFTGGWAPCRKFYIEGFHPWHQDTQHRLEDWAAVTQPA